MEQKTDPSSEQVGILPADDFWACNAPLTVPDSLASWPTVQILVLSASRNSWANPLHLSIYTHSTCTVSQKWKWKLLSRVQLFLQGIFPMQGSNPGLLHCRWILYHLSHKGSSRILERVAYPFSSGSSSSRNQTRVSCTSGRFFTSWAIREALSQKNHNTGGIWAEKGLKSG